MFSPLPLSQTTRGWLYRVCAALIPLTVAAGWVTDDQAPSVLLFVAAVLGTGAAGLATKHTPRK